MIQRRTKTVTTVNNVHTQMFGGYLTYWKLYRELLGMMRENGIKLISLYVSTNLFGCVY